MPKNLEGSHMALAYLPHSRQVQVENGQKYPISNCMVLVPMVVVVVLFLVLLCLLQVIPSMLQQDLHVLHEITSTCMAASLHHHIQW